MFFFGFLQKIRYNYYMEEDKSLIQTNFSDIAESDIFAKFYNIVKELTGINITLTNGFPSTNVKWMFSPEEMTPLCRAIRSTETGMQRCLQSDREHCELAIKNTRGIDYICHAGMVDFIVPIYNEEKLLALIVGGQILPSKPTEQGFIQIKKQLKSLKIDPETLRKAYFNSPFLSLNKMKKVMDLLLLFSQYIFEMGLHLKTISKSTDSNKTIENAKLYLKQHFREQITLTNIAKHLMLNPSYLSVLFSKVTGINLITYLQQIRIGEAKKLLGTTNFSVTKIAYSVGFGDLTHFYRVFRKFENCTPNQFRTLRCHFGPFDSHNTK